MARSSANYGFKTRASLKESAGMRELVLLCLEEGILRESQEWGGALSVFSKYRTALKDAHNLFSHY